MRTHTKVVWLGYASLALAIVWGIGLVPAIMALRLAASEPVGPATERHVRRDLRGGALLARAGLVLNGLVLAVIIWILIGTRLG